VVLQLQILVVEEQEVVLLDQSDLLDQEDQLDLKGLEAIIGLPVPLMQDLLQIMMECA
jgi:hypothetical protein